MVRKYRASGGIMKESSAAAAYFINNITNGRWGYRSKITLLLCFCKP